MNPTPCERDDTSGIWRQATYCSYDQLRIDKWATVVISANPGFTHTLSYVWLSLGRFGWRSYLPRPPVRVGRTPRKAPVSSAAPSLFSCR